MTLTEPQLRGRLAPDLYGTAWLNGEPYAIHRGEGDVLLVDFWSTTCVQCLADLRHIDRWHTSYADAGLVVVGVHAPEYDFALSRDHVEDRLKESGVTYRVVLDNKGTIRTSYGIERLPTKALIDRHGTIRYMLHGRRDFPEFERAIQFLLRESGYHGDLPSLIETVSDLERPPDEHDIELRCGYVRGTLGNPGGFAPESVHVYQDPGSRLPGRLFLAGTWWSRRNALRCLPDGPEPPSMRFVMASGDLHLVAGSVGEQADIRIELNGETVPALNMGKDLRKDSTMRSVLRLEEPRVYHVLKGLVEQMNEIVFSPSGGPADMYQLSVLGAGDIRAIFSN